MTFLGSPQRLAARRSVRAASLLLTADMSCVLIAIAQTTAWGWIAPRALALMVAGLAVCGAWIVVEVRSRNPLIDMAMMRVRGSGRP